MKALLIMLLLARALVFQAPTNAPAQPCDLRVIGFNAVGNSMLISPEDFIILIEEGELQLQ